MAENTCLGPDRYYSGSGTCLHEAYPRSVASIPYDPLVAMEVISEYKAKSNYLEITGSAPEQKSKFWAPVLPHDVI